MFLLTAEHTTRADILVPLVLGSVGWAVVVLFWASMAGAERPVLTARPAEERWRSRPVLAAALVSTAYVVPVASAVGVSALLSRLLPAPQGPVQTVMWWSLLFLVSTVVLVVVERLARRLLPLAALLRLSMLFPDRAPPRLALARKAGSIRDLEARLAHARAIGVDDEPVHAAATILALVGALHAHDRHTRGHSERVRTFVDLLADELSLSPPDRDRLRWAALLHDIGKLEITPTILNKAGTLDDEEWKAIHRHPEDGARLARPLHSWLGSWAPTIGQHHERWDGAGYPLGLRGDEICLGARIVGVADGFEVMTAVRPYKRATSVAAARQELTRCAGSQFDPVIVRAFLNVSLGRIRWSAGPVSWLAQLPFVGWLPGLARGVAASGGGAVSAVGAAAGTAALATTVFVGAMAPVAPPPSSPPPVAARENSAGSAPASPVAPGITTSGIPSPSPSATRSQGSPTSLPLGSPPASSSTTSLPRTPGPKGPAVARLEMLDADADGRVDRVLVAFSQRLASDYTAGTALWTLSNVPSGGRLVSVSVSASLVTLDLSEGPGPPDTSVGAFTVALASGSGGIQNEAGEVSSFPPTAPSDEAGPVPVMITAGSGGPQPGRIEGGDTLDVTFSEGLSPASLPAETTVLQTDHGGDGNDTLTIAGLTAGALDTGSDAYLVKGDSTATFSGSTMVASNAERTVTVTVGPICTKCGGRKASAGKLVFRPAPTLTDPSGNPAGGSWATADDFQLF